MNSLFFRPNQFLLIVALILLQTSCTTDPEYRSLDFYDKMFKTSKGWEFPPYIPGTEGQKEVKVQVLDATTMQPIAGAIVVGGYYAAGRSGDSGNVSCARSESAVSDAEGWATLPNDQDERIKHPSGGSWMFGPQLKSAYKRGYQMANRIYYVIAGGDNEWFVRKEKANPPGKPYVDGDITFTKQFSINQKDALLETKERSQIYLMPSTATTKEERLEELNRMGYRGGPCFFSLPFAFSRSEGGLAAMRAVYQEMQDIGGYPENAMRYQRFLVEDSENNLKKFRSGAYGNWGKP